MSLSDYFYFGGPKIIRKIKRVKKAKHRTKAALRMAIRREYKKFDHLRLIDVPIETAFKILNKMDFERLLNFAEASETTKQMARSCFGMGNLHAIQFDPQEKSYRIIEGVIIARPDLCVRAVRLFGYKFTEASMCEGTNATHLEELARHCGGAVNALCVAGHRDYNEKSEHVKKLMRYLRQLYLGGANDSERILPLLPLQECEYLTKLVLGFPVEAYKVWEFTFPQLQVLKAKDYICSPDFIRRHPMLTEIIINNEFDSVAEELLELKVTALSVESFDTRDSTAKLLAQMEHLVKFETRLEVVDGFGDILRSNAGMIYNMTELSLFCKHDIRPLLKDIGLMRSLRILELTLEYSPKYNLARSLKTFIKDSKAKCLDTISVKCEYNNIYKRSTFNRLANYCHERNITFHYE